MVCYHKRLLEWGACCKNYDHWEFQQQVEATRSGSGISWGNKTIKEAKYVLIDILFSFLLVLLIKKPYFPPSSINSVLCTTVFAWNFMIRIRGQHKTSQRSLWTVCILFLTIRNEVEKSRMEMFYASGRLFSAHLQQHQHILFKRLRLSSKTDGHV